MTVPFEVSPAASQLLGWLNDPDCEKYLESKTAEQLAEIIDSGDGTSLVIAKESWNELHRGFLSNFRVGGSIARLRLR